MTRPKIYASAISNLSDARYFAAMGADVMGFEVDEQSQMQQIEEMISWVEGPEIALEILEDVWTPKVLEAIERINPGMLVLPVYWQDVDFFANKKVLLKKIIDDDSAADNDLVRICDVPLESMNDAQLKKLSSPEALFLDCNWSKADLDFALKNLPTLGLVLKGGAEEAPGIKSFDELDAIFDYLDENFS